MLSYISIKVIFMHKRLNLNYINLFNTKIFTTVFETCVLIFSDIKHIAVLSNQWIQLVNQQLD